MNIQNTFFYYKYSQLLLISCIIFAVLLILIRLNSLFSCHFLDILTNYQNLYTVSCAVMLLLLKLGRFVTNVNYAIFGIIFMLVLLVLSSGISKKLKENEYDYVFF